ncbi:MAG: hypothetical protein VXZ13_06900 [Pseudomonadota bacterium]|nr:hypothetical protein [Pseudomonadota bacterium]MEC8488618.1 hypothetical protein [Pseudomonadota bacterium]|tara:strand:+ start:374 stop:841 length:468 start_codon:yes stop_codon:yes gene_type:complete
MDPISTGLAGIALVQKSVDFIKSNIDTANSISDIAGAIDGLFAGEKQVQQERFGGKSILGQTKDAAHSVIDAKLAQEQLRDMQILIDNRFGYGTWRQIIAEKNKRIREEKERIAEEKRIARQKKKERDEIILVVGSILTVAILFVLAVVGFVKLV